MKSLNISFSLRAFLVYFVILGSLAWYIVGNALERLNDGMRQSAESVMVDVSQMLAAKIESALENSNFNGERNLTPNDMSEIAELFQNIKSRKISAQIYNVKKLTTESDTYITDKNGIVIYDSNQESLGLDFSSWRDVRLTLAGKYGARTSFKDQTKTQEHDEKIMVIAAPIKWRNEIIGTVSSIKSIKSLEGHLKGESQQLKRYTLLLVLLAIVISYLVSVWFKRSLDKISQYAQTMASGKQAIQPRFLDHRLDELSTSVLHLRDQLDGKEYVEQYIHSLTHELKTPITSIRGATELLLEGMPPEEQIKFISNIHTSNHRMAQLVEKMLSLAKLESQTEIVKIETFNLRTCVNNILNERVALTQQKNCEINLLVDTELTAKGDRLLIRQAIANLIDNAIDFCQPNGLLSIIAKQINNNDQHLQQNTPTIELQVYNDGEHIPDFALPRLYERFFSLPRKTSSGNEGAKSTGLGLSFVCEIMKLHTGSIDIKNSSRSNSDGDIQDGVTAKLIW